MYYALNIGNTILRWKLLEEEEDDQLKVADFIKMEEKDLATDEHKQKIKEQKEYDM